mmetsp:Transcript_162649/g.521494  ORF Transcript_162649/g.521494 Transcript_162649/m.521494 type:complete len:215 (+) Transcript_162649:316-960(+)
MSISTQTRSRCSHREMRRRCLSCLAKYITSTSSGQPTTRSVREGGRWRGDNRSRVEVLPVAMLQLLRRRAHRSARQPLCRRRTPESWCLRGVRRFPLCLPDNHRVRWRESRPAETCLWMNWTERLTLSFRSKVRLMAKPGIRTRPGIRRRPRPRMLQSHLQSCRPKTAFGKDTGSSTRRSRWGPKRFWSSSTPSATWKAPQARPSFWASPWCTG